MPVPSDVSDSPSSSTARQIFGIGTVVQDHVVVLPEFPSQDTKTTVLDSWHQVGGPVPVALATAAFYGSRAAFMGRWGHDPAGRLISDTLPARGVDISLSSTDADWATGFAQVWTEPKQGTRTLAYSRGQFPLPGAAEVQANAARLDECRLLHLDGWAAEAAFAAASYVRQRAGDAQVVLDAGSKKPGMERLLPLVDVLVASSLFCRSWFGMDDVPAEKLLDLGPRAVVLTRGGDGLSFVDAERRIDLESIPIQPVDTNGAGDIFSGALLHGLAQSWPIDRSLRFANVVAGLACQQQGNASLAPLEQVDGYLCS